jgi:hypothetical protein
MKTKILYQLSIIILCYSISSYSQTTVNLKPIKDNSIYSESTNNSNGQGSLFSGRTCATSPTVRRALLQFDLSGIPAGSMITAVTLIVDMDKAGPNSTTETYNLHSLTTAFGEGASDAPGQEGTGTAAIAPDATWNHAMFNTSLWTTPGGDYNANPVSSVGMNTTLGNKTFPSSPNFVSLAQTWLNSPSTNFGIIMIGDETQLCTARRFGSREDSGSEPILSVTYDEDLSVQDYNFKKNIRLSSNPTSGKVDILFAQEYESIKINVINNNGKNVLSHKINSSNKTSFDISTVPSGIYFVKIINEAGETAIMKISKE